MSERIYAALRERIMEGALTPGLILREGELAETIGVGRTPARMALRRLQSDALVIKREGRGFCVAGEDSPGQEFRRPLRDLLPDLVGEIVAGAAIRPWRRGVYPTVERQIASCLVFGRFQINQTALADAFGVSRTIAHEVLVNLERIGFVRHEDNGRWYAGRLQPRELEEMYELRWLLEPVALRQAAPGLRPLQLVGLRSHLVKAIEAGEWNGEDLNDIETALHVDTVLRCTNRRMGNVLRYCQLPVIVSYATVLRGRDVRRSPTGIPETLAEHLEVVELLLAGRVDAAAQALEAHIRHGLEFTLPHFADPPALPADKLPPYMIEAD